MTERTICIYVIQSLAHDWSAEMPRSTDCLAFNIFDYCTGGRALQQWWILLYAFDSNAFVAIGVVGHTRGIITPPR